MYLKRILGTKTKVNILATLIENPQRVYVEKELAAESASSLSEVNRQVMDLVKSGLVKTLRVSRDKTYQINKGHFLFRCLRSLFKDLVNVYRQAAQDLASFSSRRHKVSCVLLIGSVIRREIRDDIVEAPSDIDIVFVVPTKRGVQSLKKSLIRYTNSEVGLRYGITIYPIVVSEQEYTQRVHSDPFFAEVHGKGEVIHGRKPRRTGAVGSRKS